MPWFKTEKLISNAPVLVSGEKLTLAVSDVLLESVKSLSTLGVLYITTQRLIFVDKNKLAFEINRDCIGKCETADCDDDNKQKLLINVEQQWVCSICSFCNAASTDTCATCGVPMQTEDTPFKTSISPEIKPDSRSELNLGECSQCTFMNHPSLTFCEMCGAPLSSEESEESSIVSFTVPSSKLQLILDEIGLLSSYTRKKDEPVSKLSQAPIFGINRLQKHSQSTQNQYNEILDEAMSSKSGFKAVAKDLIRISEKLGTPNISSIPVVMGATSAERIAYELADFLIGSNVLALKGGMLTFHELYALYNRSRGVSLISAQELLDALSLCERLDLPIRCRTLGSGLRVVESRGALDQALKRLLHWITAESTNQNWRAYSGFSARDIAEHFGYCVQIAVEELDLAESRGNLCRDENISGLRYFPNLITKAKVKET